MLPHTPTRFFLLMALVLACGRRARSQDAPTPPPQLQNRPAPVDPGPLSPEQAEALRISRLPYVNGVPYDQPSAKDFFLDYLRDSYGLPAFERSTVRALYSEARGTPTQWGQDFPGFMQRYGSAVAVTAINGNVRYGMETIFHEDLRYIPCHGCTVKQKIANALLAEFTARHDENGRRFFTLTPVISDFSGPIIAHSLWYPNFDPFAGVVATRTVFATRVGLHLFQEFRPHRHHTHPEITPGSAPAP